MKIFISYSSKDASILESLVERILQLGLGINKKTINCTGIEGCMPKTGEDFKLWIKNNIQSADIIIQIISQNYKASEICLNELGASWMANAKIIPLLLSPLDYDNVGFIHNSNQLLKIESKDDIHRFCDELIGLMRLKPKTSELNKQIDKFLDEIPKDLNLILPAFKKVEVQKTEVNFGLFDNLLNERFNTKYIIKQCKPTLKDCELVFNKTVASQIYEYYTTLFNQADDTKQLSEYEVYDFYKATFDELYNNNHKLPGGMTKLAKSYLINEDIDYYRFRYRMKHEEFGTTMSVWCFLNGRWVLFPKPWIFFVNNRIKNIDTV